MSSNPFAGSAFAEDEDKEVPITTIATTEEECGAEEEAAAHEDEGGDIQPEEGEVYEAEEQQEEGNDNVQQQEEEEGTIANEGNAEEGGEIDVADDVQEEPVDNSEEAVAQAQEAVDECVANANEEYSAELFVSMQAELAEALSSNVALTNSHSIVSAKLESTEKELQLVKETLAQLQQLMASSAAAAAAVAAGEQTTTTTIPTTATSEAATIPSFDAVELALELEVTDRKLIKATHAAEASALLASKWEEESKRYAGMYHEVVGGRYVPLLSDHGAAIIQQGSEGSSSNLGTKVIAYFSDLLSGKISSTDGKGGEEVDGVGDNTTTFSKPQREILLDYILACGYELQFMMMRTHVNDLNLRRRTSELEEVAATKALIGEKRIRSDDNTTTTTNVSVSVKQGLLEELIQELSSSGSSLSTTKWDLSKTQLTPASTATINALRAHVTKFDQLERTVQAQEGMLESARSISANPLFELAWDRKMDTITTTTTTDANNNSEELILLKGRNRLLTGACRMYYRRSQQLLIELANKNTSSSPSTMGSIVAGGAVSSAEIVASYAEGMDALRRAYITTLEEVALGVSTKLATLTTLHRKFVLGVNNNSSDNEDEEDDAEKPEDDHDEEQALSELTNSLITSLQSFVEAGHSTMAALKEGVINAVNTHLSGPLNAASIQHDRDVAVFAQLFSEADAVIVESVFSQDGGEQEAVDVEQFRALMAAILHRTPTIVPTVALPTSLATPTSSTNISGLIQTAANQCATTMLTSHDQAVKSNNSRTDFVTSKVASLLAASSGSTDGNGAALLLKELQSYQTAHRTISTELSTTSSLLKVARGKLEDLQKQHATVKADYEKEAKAHSEVSVMLRDSLSNLTKTTTLSQTQLAEQKSQYEAQITALNNTIQQHQDEYVSLEAKLAEAVAAAAAAVAEAQAEEEEVAAAVEETAEYEESTDVVNNNNGEDEENDNHQAEEEAEAVTGGDAEEQEDAEQETTNNAGDNVEEEENNNEEMEEAGQDENEEECEEGEEEYNEEAEEGDAEEEEEEAEGTIF